jgi:hypothetical protein
VRTQPSRQIGKSFGNYILDSLRESAVPKPLDAITDLVLAFRPAPKSESSKKRFERNEKGLVMPKYSDLKETRKV